MQAVLRIPRWRVGPRGEIVERNALPMLLPAWEDLSRRCAEDNVYYTPRYATALLEHVDRSSSVQFAVVWDGTDLVAFMPIVKSRLSIPFVQPTARAWRTKYTFSCMPLLDDVRRSEAAAALLDVLATISAGDWVIPTVNVGGATSSALTAALERSGYRWLHLNHFQRAILEAGGSFDEHLKSRIASKRRRELARNRRRLEELGALRHQVHRAGEGLERAVEAFLQLEASGWKGRRGTALACSETTRRFALSAFTGDPATSICRADVLTLDDKPIAVGLAACSGRTGFTVKCSFDEAYRSYGAGLILEMEVIRSFFSDKWAARLDAATAGTHVIDALWSGRIEVADLMFTFSRRAPELRLAALQMSDRMRSEGKASIKACLARVAQLRQRLSRAARSSPGTGTDDVQARGRARSAQELGK